MARIANQLTIKQIREVLQKSEALLKTMQQTVGIGEWELDIEANTLFWTDQIYRIYEVDLDCQPTLAQTIDFYIPNHRPVLARAIQQAMENGIVYNLELTAKEKIYECIFQENFLCLMRKQFNSLAHYVNT